ncbi:bifunctional protein-serine/threonine kinase/phosphatase [Pseudomonas flexibilis]|nr:bifunctional protein-serine/threonine kinase/phosphatase [Pseudomonas flexibilis]SCX76445.1 Serine/threonine protein kinase [Pseudomonas flexibilis]
MPTTLAVTVGQFSDKGRKPLNQDFHGLRLPDPEQQHSKGIALAIADGISSSEVSHIASETAVKSFLEDYFCTPDAWSVKQSGQRVLVAANAWLHAQTRRGPYRYDRDRGHVCTFSALVLKSTTAHLFHVGDARLYRLRNGQLEALTEEHRVWLSPEQSCLGRALGINPHLEIDYRALPLQVGDLFLLLTDGVHEWLDEAVLLALIDAHGDDLDATARRLVLEAHARGSPDNLTAQLVRINALPDGEAGEVQRQLEELALPPLLEPPARFDGYRILRELHASSRSHVYLAEDEHSGERLVLKTPSLDLRHDRAYLERLLLEEWIARRVHSVHVVRAPATSRPRQYLYSVAEYVEGQTLAQWMTDHPQPSLEQVRDLLEQIARGLRAFHRLEMLHRDLRPENILIDAGGTLKLIDFGSAQVSGLAEGGMDPDNPVPGALAYTAPEYFLGEGSSVRSDLFSLGVIAYRLLGGDLPYGAEVSRTRSRTAQLRLRYRPLWREDRDLPTWVDDVLRKAVHPNPARRYGELSEFLHDLRQPPPELLHRTKAPLLQRHPLRFWQTVVWVQLGVIVLLLLR